MASSINRRTFIAQSAGALAASAMLHRPALGVETEPKKIRLGIVGGRFGLGFQFHLHPNCVVEAVSDLRPERKKQLQEVYSCAKAYDSLEELVKDPNIDAVGIFTDAPLHVQHVEECMKHGKHALSAVPACVGSLEEADRLLNVVKQYGLTYMMAETSYYQQFTISARKFQQEGQFGEIFYCQSEYQHDGLDSLFIEDGKRTWRYGFAPMHYPTHCTAHLIGVTGERLTEVSCHGWGDGNQVLRDNVYKNPFWNESAMFRTDKGHAFRVNVWWRGAHRGCERAEWIGNKMSFYGEHPNGMGPVIVRSAAALEKDAGGFDRTQQEFEAYQQPNWWATDLLPEPLRIDSGHHGSHSFITHEFVDSLVHARQPTVNVYEALAYTVPGIVAHESALRNGELLKIPQYDPTGTVA